MIKAVGWILFFVILFALAGWWQVFRWHDCRHVGHSKLYCIMTVGK